MSASDVEKDLVLNRLLAEHETASYELPPLVREDNWFQDWMHELWTSFTEALQQLLGQSSAATSAAFSAITIFAYILILVTSCYLVFVIVQAVRKRIMPAKIAGAESPAGFGQTKAEALSGRLESAVAAQLWDQAMRLRWKLYLTRTNRDADRTPLEVFDQAVRAAVPLETLFSQYGAMFGQRDAQEHDFRDYDQFLAETEQRSAQASASRGAEGRSA